jgi:hypothetical protein
MSSSIVLNTGPPSGEQRRTPGTQPPRVLQNRRRQLSGTQNAPLAVSRQVAVLSPGLVAIRLALPASVWDWLRWICSQRRAR